MMNENQKILLKRLLNVVVDIAEETEKDVNFNMLISKLGIFNFEELELMEIIDVLAKSVHELQV